MAAMVGSNDQQRVLPFALGLEPQPGNLLRFRGDTSSLAQGVKPPHPFAGSSGKPGWHLQELWVCVWATPRPPDGRSQENAPPR